MAELLALSAALSFSGGAVVSKVATRAGASAIGFLAGLMATVMAIVVMAVTTVDVWAMDTGAVLFFAAGGIVGTGAGRGLAVWGVREAGASVAVPLQSSANPIVAITAGLVFFDERIGAQRWTAVALILLGVWLCARGGSANLVTRPQLGSHRSRRWAVVLIPLAAGTVFALGDVLRVAGLERDGHPVLGALIGSTSALVLWTVITVVRQARPASREPLRISRAMLWWALYGTLSGTAQVLVILALQAGELSTVSPILASQPVLVLLLSALLLRKVERLRLGAVLGAVVVTAGVIVIAST